MKRNNIKNEGDRIRSMSNEELAHYLTEGSWDCNDCEFGSNISDNPLEEKCDGNCYQHCLNYLEREIKK